MKKGKKFCRGLQTGCGKFQKKKEVWKGLSKHNTKPERGRKIVDSIKLKKRIQKAEQGGGDIILQQVKRGMNAPGGVFLGLEFGQTKQDLHRGGGQLAKDKKRIDEKSGHPNTALKAIPA